jgi:hypothetical protein
VAAAQAVAVGCAAVGRNVLAVLALDGSEASRDALLPHIHRAVVAGGRALDDVRALDGHAAPSVMPLLAEARARGAHDPGADAFIHAVVGAALPSMRIEAMLGTHDGARTAVGQLRIDTTRADWFSFELTLIAGDVRTRGHWEASQAIVDEFGLGLRRRSGCRSSFGARKRSSAYAGSRSPST